MSDCRPIGVFDSGVGGITVLSELQKAMPNEEYVYLGDTARVPYGNKSEELIIQYTKECVQFLMKKDVKLIVIACNTASSYGYEIAREFAGDIEIIEMIRPAAEYATKHSAMGSIGIIGTKGTIRNGAYNREIDRLTEGGMKVSSIACPLFVPFIEEGKCEHPSLDIIAREYLEPFLERETIDTLVLGCTHYPYIEKSIQKILGESVTIVNTGTPAAVKAKVSLEMNNLLCEEQKGGKTRFFVTDSPSIFAGVAYEKLGFPIDDIQRISLDELR